MMKTKLLLMLVAIALVAGTAQANLLVNPGFEEGRWKIDGTPDDWAHVPVAYPDEGVYHPATHSWISSADEAHSGSKYIKMNMWYWGSTALLGQTVDVTEGQEYAFSVWAKSPIEGMQAEVWVWVDWTEPNAFNTEYGYDIISEDRISYWDWVKDDWEHVEFGTLMAPESATQATYYLTGILENPMGILFDDAYMGIPLPSFPSPVWEGFVHPGNVDLNWTNLPPNAPETSVYVDVWFGTRTDPNELHPSYDMTKIVDAVEDTNSATVEALDPNTYYWQVKSYLEGDPAVVDYDTGDPNYPSAIEGHLWSFTTANDLKPSVDAGDDMITWSGQSVPVDATVVDDGVSPLSYAWRVNPDYGVVFDPNEYVEDPTVTITLPPGYIGVVNPGFENPALPDGMSISEVGGASIDGWRQGYYGLDSGTWYTWDGDDCGVVNPDIKYGYDGEAPEGENIAFAYAWSSYRMGLGQTLPVTLQANTTYNLSVLVGKADNAVADYAIELIAGHVRIELAEGVAPLNQWVSASLTLTTGTDVVSDPNLVHLGQPLKIRLLATGGIILNFDDVLMTSDPPPSSAPTFALTLRTTDAIGPDSDRMTIDVYNDACLAAVGAGLSADNPGDLDGDCDTDIVDLAAMAITWLEDKRIEAQHKHTADIYYDDFSGDGLSTLNGTAPDIRPSTETWISAEEWADDGTNSAGYVCALLPFVPSADNVYQLSATFDVTIGGEDWFALGFAQESNFRNWNVSTNPVGWILNREIGESVSYLGPMEEGGPVVHATTNEPYNFMMELDTNPALWTVEWFAAPAVPAGQPLVSIRGPEEFTTNPTITHVAFGATGGDNSDLSRGSVDNFKLHEGPLPPLPGYLVNAGASWATWAGESITLDDAEVIPATAETYLWTADPDTDVEITGSATLTPKVTFTGSTTDNPTIIELTLDVTFSIDPESDSDTTKIYIYDDSCKAAIGAGQEFDPADIDTDCQTRLEDFAGLAETWLDDYTLTESAKKP